jgi:DNA-nicking Smr family endonuclease
MLDWTDREPAVTFDLHGQSVLEAVRSAELFLASQRKARPGAVVRLITGRGRGGGPAPIRGRIGSLLRRLRESGAVVRDFEREHGEGSYLVRLAG